MCSHRIAVARFEQPNQALDWFGAMQAQDYPQARWAVGVRCINASDTTVEQAIADKTMLRTWAMRGTLQLLAPQNVRWLLELVGPRLIARGAGDDLRRFGLDEAEFTKIEGIFYKILRGTQLTRKETFAALEEHGIATEGQRGYHVLNRAGLRGQICFGVWRGKEETFTLLEEWLPPTKPMPRDQALAELALRYFRSHGPATLQDYVWWSSLTVAEARQGLEAIRSGLIEERVGNTTYWLAANTPMTKLPSPSVYLLAGFDEYLLGYTDRSAILSTVQNTKAILSNGIFKPTVVVDGQIVGIWARKVHKGKLTVTHELSAPLSTRAQKALLEAAETYGHFLNIQRTQITVDASKQPV